MSSPSSLKPITLQLSNEEILNYGNLSPIREIFPEKNIPKDIINEDVQTSHFSQKDEVNNGGDDSVKIVCGHCHAVTLKADGSNVILE